MWALRRIMPTRTAPTQPRRVVLILPCCIGDVILATATLQALRRAYPAAHITWAVGRWSRPAIEDHDLLDDLLDTGDAALPLYTPGAFWGFVRALRAGRYDLAVSLVRSPLMSAAVLLSGIPYRAGLDSAGRGFGYNIRAAADPAAPRQEGQLYLDVVRALGLDTAGCYANVPVREDDRAAVQGLLAARGVSGRYLVLNPAGGSNPGMLLDAKRWPPEHFAALARRLAAALDATPTWVAGPQDGALIAAVTQHLPAPPVAFVGELRFGQIAALARDAVVYVGNDTGLTHLAAAAGASTVMIFGPSDPARYTPLARAVLALWKPAAVRQGGVAAGAPADWDWARDGIGVEDAARAILDFVTRPPAPPSAPVPPPLHPG